MWDPNLENFQPMSSRENYLYLNCLQLWDETKECHDERNKLLETYHVLWDERSKFFDERQGLYGQISNKDQVINDLNLKLSEEYENSQDLEKRMKEERKLKNLAKGEFEWKCQRENDLLKVCSIHKFNIEQLKTDKSKLIQQNKELSSQLDKIKKINHDDEHKKKNFQLGIEVLKEKFIRKLANAFENIEKLQENEKNLKLEMNKLNIDHCKEKNDLEHLLSSTRSMLSNTCKKNEALINDKSIMQKQIDSLSLVVEDVNNKLTIVTSEKNNLTKQNGTLKDDIILEKEKLKKYEILQEEKMSKIKEVAICMCNELKCLKKAFKILNNTLDNTKDNIEAFNMKFKIQNNLQQYKAKNSIFLIIFIILQSTYTFTKKKISNENIINLKKPLLYVKRIKEYNLDDTLYIGITKRVHIYIKNQKLMNFNINVKQIYLDTIEDTHDKIKEWKLKIRNQDELSMIKSIDKKMQHISKTIIVSIYSKRNSKISNCEINKFEEYPILDSKIKVLNFKSSKQGNIRSVNIRKISIGGKLNNILFVVLIRNEDDNSNQFIIVITYYVKCWIWNLEINSTIWDPGILKKLIIHKHD